MSSSSASCSIPDLAGTLGAQLRAPYRLLQRRLYAELARRFPEIRPAHSAVFRHLAPAGSRLTDLAEQAQMTKQSMGYLVDYLVEHGHLTSSRHPGDRRATLIRLTPKGGRVIEAALAISHELQTEAEKALGTRRLAELRRALAALQKALEAGEAPTKQ
jgi:DNA-binding MarR family transcriptional regulator